MTTSNPGPAMSAPERLEQRRAEYEASLRSLQESHHGAVIACQGYHDQRRPAGRTVIARFASEFTDGQIVALCARCTYGLDGLDIVARLPIRYPASR